MIECYCTSRREIFTWIYFSESIFFNISRGFSSVNWLPVDFFQGFIYLFCGSQFYQCFIYFDFLRFVLQLVVCETENSYQNFSLFQIVLFGYRRLNSQLNAQEQIKRNTYNKKIYIFLSMLSVLILLIYRKMFSQEHR